MHLGLEHDGLTPASGLRPVHRDVRVAQQDLAGVGAVVVEHDARRGRHRELASVDLVGERDRGQHLLGQVGHVVLPVGPFEHHDELVAADAGGDVAEPEQRGDARGSGDEHPIAEAVPQRVVDVLEVIQTDQDGRDGGAAAVASEHAIELVQRLDPVRRVR